MINSQLVDSQLLIEQIRGKPEVTGGTKKFIKVLVLLGSKKSATLTYKEENEEGEDSYVGFPYFLWLRIKEALGDNYEFKEDFGKIINYDKVIESIGKGKWDICIGLFYRTPKRMNLVNYTSPIVLSQNSILTYDKIGYVDRLLIPMRDLLAGPMIILFVLSIIFGLILWKAEPNRGILAPAVSESKFKGLSKRNLSMRRSVMSTIAAFFGEMGFLAENTTLGYKGMIVVIVIMLVAFNFVLVLQAQATTFDAELQKRGVITRDNLKEKHLLCQAGHAAAAKFKRFGAEITYVEDKTLEELLEYYSENRDKYNGITVDSMSAAHYVTDELNLESEGFGLQMTAFPVFKNQVEFLKDVNKQILFLQDSLEQEKICKGFFKGDDGERLCPV